MKLLILILSFTIQNKAVVWQLSYTTNLSFQQLTSALRTSGNFTDIQTSDSVITARIENVEADYTGTSKFKAPYYISQSLINGLVVIEYGSGSYTVSVKRIIFEHQGNDALSRQGEKTSIETYALNRGKTDFKSMFKRTAWPILDQTFQSLFELPQRP